MKCNQIEGKCTCKYFNSWDASQIWRWTRGGVKFLELFHNRSTFTNAFKILASFKYFPRIFIFVKFNSWLEVTVHSYFIHYKISNMLITPYVRMSHFDGSQCTFRIIITLFYSFQTNLTVFHHCRPGICLKFHSMPWYLPFWIILCFYLHERWNLSHLIPIIKEAW